MASKPLPFRKPLKKADGATYKTILSALANPTFKRYAIDDSQYLLSFELFDRANERGYEKFTDMAVHFYDLIKRIIRQLPSDVIVYFLHHVEQNDGKIKAKTIGKMLDEKLTVEGLFTVVLMAENMDGTYCLRTKSNGSDTVKTPMDMFETERIDNDLKLVDEAIRNYWNLNQKEESEEQKNETI